VLCTRGVAMNRCTLCPVCALAFLACGAVREKTGSSNRTQPAQTGRAARAAPSLTPPRLTSAPILPMEPGDSAIERVARAHTAEVQNCWRQAKVSSAPEGPSYAKVVINFHVSEVGLVTNVRVTQQADAYPRLGDCVAGRVARWQFPAGRGELDLQLPFVFGR